MEHLTSSLSNLVTIKNNQSRRIKAPRIVDSSIRKITCYSGRTGLPFSQLTRSLEVTGELCSLRGHFDSSYHGHGEAYSPTCQHDITVS